MGKNMLTDEFESLCNHGKAMCDLAAKRGLKVERSGLVWRLTGPGVYVTVTNPALLNKADMEGRV